MGYASPIQAQRATEYEVKAAFLYNFARFVTWPDTAFAKDNSPFIIGLFGTDPFGQTLSQTITGKTTQSRPFQIRHITKIEDATQCHILFISDPPQKQLQALLHQMLSLPILTIGEQDGFCQIGGMINFVIEERHVRFEINPEAAERANLVISSRLLRLARIVKDE